ncbi:MAG: hypothetical protein K2H40_11990, partial [Lachnospiraceae bacterium]|nr:hypothetical protein [Lachnospiraceae bacterium]
NRTLNKTLDRTLDKKLNRAVIIGTIIRTNLRHHFLLPFLSAIAILFVTALVFPITALKGADVGRPIEFFLPFAGAALLTPVFLPEQDRSIRDVIASKKTNTSVIYALRLLYSAFALAALVLLFIALLYRNECEVHWFHLYGGIASAFFMGSIGFMVSGLSGNTIMGYMTTVIYHLVCYGLKKQLGVFWLFRMSAGIETGKGWLFVGGAAMIVVAFIVLEIRRRK